MSTEVRTLARPTPFTGTGRPSNALRSGAALPGRRLDRCSSFLTLTPTESLPRSVTLQVTMPPGTSRCPGA